MTGGPRLPPAGTEALDSRAVAPDVARATLRDIARTNAWFGGRPAVAYAFRRLVRGRAITGPLTVLDVASGGGDVPHYLVSRMRTRGITLQAVALDHLRQAARLARARRLSAIVADFEALPIRDRSADIAIASLVLHHLPRDRIVPFLRSLDQLARFGVIVTDLERSRLAAHGIRLASAVLRFHPATRHDGLVSVRRGFTRRELTRLLTAAGVHATVQRRWGWRLVAYWRTTHANG